MAGNVVYCCLWEVSVSGGSTVSISSWLVVVVVVVVFTVPCRFSKVLLCMTTSSVRAANIVQD